VSAATTSFTVTSFKLQAAATPSTVLAAATTSMVLTAATSFTLLVSNSYNEGLSEAKNKCGVARIGGIKLKTKQLKRRWKQVASIKRRDETQYILPDIRVAYSSRAVTYLSEVGLSDRYCNLPLVRRRKLCQYAKS
jgi:hypothetical protein